MRRSHVSGVRAACLLVVIATLCVACARSRDNPRAGHFAALPDWTGVWQMENAQVGVDGFPFIELEPGTPMSNDSPLAIFNLGAPLKPEARAMIMGIIADGNPAQEVSGADGWGYPFMMTAPPPLQFLITPEETVIFNGYRDMRRIYTDGRERPPVEDRWPPTTWGDSLGHWEGDTLVIETIDVREPREYFGLVLPFTSQARYTERLRKTGPDRIEGEITVEDPGLLTAPLTAKLAYVRDPVLDTLVLDSFRGERTGFDGEFNTIED